MQLIGRCDVYNRKYGNTALWWETSVEGAGGFLWVTLWFLWGAQWRWVCNEVTVVYNPGDCSEEVGGAWAHQIHAVDSTLTSTVWSSRLSSRTNPAGLVSRLWPHLGLSGPAELPALITQLHWPIHALHMAVKVDSHWAATVRDWTLQSHSEENAWSFHCSLFATSKMSGHLKKQKNKAVLKKNLLIFVHGAFKSAFMSLLLTSTHIPMSSMAAMFKVQSAGAYWWRGHFLKQVISGVVFDLNMFHGWF